MNIKGRIPIIKQLIYNIPVNVLNHSIDRWQKDRARLTKKKGAFVYEFAKRGNRLPVYKRSKGKMFVFTNDGKIYQPMKLDIEKDKIYLPETDMDTWRDMEMRRSEEKIKSKADAKADAIRFIGIGICAFLVCIGLSFFLGEVMTQAPVSCTIQGIDLVQCYNLLHNITQSSGGII